MDDNGTKGSWPSAVERRVQERVRLLRNPPSADFVSQLIAERQGLAAPDDGLVGTAVGAYETGSQIAVRRLPAGYRKTIVA